MSIAPATSPASMVRRPGDGLLQRGYGLFHRRADDAGGREIGHGGPPESFGASPPSPERLFDIQVDDGVDVLGGNPGLVLEHDRSDVADVLMPRTALRPDGF